MVNEIFFLTLTFSLGGKTNSFFLSIFLLPSKKIVRLKMTFIKKSQKKCENCYFLCVASHLHQSWRLHHWTLNSFAAMTVVKRSWSTQVTSIATMYMNILPFSITLMPNSRLFWLMCMSVWLSENCENLMLLFEKSIKM